MKKFYLLTKTLLVATLLMLGATNAWGEGTKRTIDIVDYSSIAETDWTAPGNGTATLKTSSAVGTPSAYSQCYHSGSGGRGTYKGVSLSYTLGTGYTTSAVSTSGYNIEFDFSFTSGKSSGSGPHQGEFIISTGTPSGNAYVSDDATCLFSLSYPSTASGSNPDNLYINDLANSTGSTIAYGTYGGTWMHLKLVVTSGNIAYTLTKYSDGSAVASGNKTVTGLVSPNRFYALLGRGGGIINFTNYEIYDYVDAEIVSNPSIADPVYAGANRTVTVTAGTSSKGNAVTTYYTIDGTEPSASNYAGSFTTATKDVTITSNCTLKAITISSTTEESNIASKAVTAGKLTLNAPTFTKTAYSAGNYTITISDNQSSLEYVPASTTIKYRVGTTGEYTTYSTGVSVPEGSSLYAYVEATDYTNSSTSECATTARTGMYQVWTQDYTQVSKAAGTGTQQINLNSSVDFTVGTRKFYNIVSYGATPTAVEVTTNVGLNTSSYFHFRCNGSSSGILKNSNSGGSTGYLGIRNLIPGQIIKISVNDTKLSAEAGAVLLEGLSTSKDYFFKASSTVASIFFPHGTYNYVYDVTVYNTKDIYNSLKTYATALAAVDNDNSAANSTLASVITAQNSAVESATTGAEISTALTTLRSAMDTYASVANPTIGNKFDLSYMLLNPKFENIKDWEAAEVYGWNTDYSDNNFAVRTNLNSGKDGIERWRATAYTTANTFAIYQKVTLPEGNYSFNAEALANQSSTMVMAAGATEGDAITSSDFAAYSVAFTQASESEVKVGIKISSEGTNTCNWTGITSPKLYKEPASSVSATLGSNGYATFASPYALDLTAATQTANSFKAYRASAVNDETVTFKDDVNQTVVANTGILLQGTANAVVTIPVVASGSALADNALQVNVAGTTFAAAANTTYYGMNKGSDPLTFGTFNPSSVAIPANKAYLSLTSNAARSIRVVFGDDITGIENVEAAAEAVQKEGKFFKDGKLFIFKNGKKYNAAGAQIK